LNGILKVALRASPLMVLWAAVADATGAADACAMTKGLDTRPAQISIALSGRRPKDAVKV
jgi:hypothetical protein